MSAKKTTIKITSAVVIQGDIIRPDQGDKSVVTIDEAAAKNLLSRGKAELLTSDEDDEKPLDELTVPELKAIAKDYKIKGSANMGKDALIEAIEAYEENEGN